MSFKNFLLYCIVMQEKDKKYMLSLEGLQVRDIEATFMGRRYQFALFNVDGRSAVALQ